MSDQTLERRLLDILQLKDPNVAEGLSDTSFIYYFSVLEYDPSESTSWARLTSFFTDNYTLRNFLPEFSNEDELDDFFRSRYDQLQEVHDFFIELIKRKVENPDSTIYYHLMNAYVEVLRNFEIFVDTLGFLNRNLDFSSDNYVNPKDAKRILNDVPEELWFKINYRLINNVKEEGITAHEMQSLKDSVHTKDIRRKSLHDELLDYGKKLGYDERQVMADIVFKKHNHNHYLRIDNGTKSIYIHAGVLLMSDFDPESGATIIEADFNNPNKKGFFYESIIKYKEVATKMMERFLSGGRVISPSYHSRITYPMDVHGDEESLERIKADAQILQKIKDENPDVPINYGFEVSHCAHGTVVCSHNLKANISGFYSDTTGEKLRLFIENLNQAIKRDHF